MDVLDHPLSIEKVVLAKTRRWVSALIWLGGFVCMLWMQSSLQLGLAAVTVMLILTSATASLFVRPVTAVVYSLIAALVFNVLFVPPVGRFELKLGANHELILLVALAVSLMVGVLTSRLRIVGLALRQRIGQLKTLNSVSNTLNRSEDPAQVSAVIQSALVSIVDGKVALVIVADEPLTPPENTAEPELQQWGSMSPDQLHALRECIARQEPVPVDPAGMCLPLQGQLGTLGAALLTWPDKNAQDRADLDAAQTLCNLFGMALERAQRTRRAATASKAAFRRQHSNLVLSAVSHEYRTPLSTILSYASQMRSQSLPIAPDQQRRMLDNIIEEVDHLNRVTTNMLQLARLDAQAFSLQLEWESVEDLIGSVLHRFRTRQPGWQATVDLAPALPLIRCDAVLLAQVFENLLDNARRYAGPQPPRISAWTEDATLHVAVMDRGPGIDASLQSRLFQVFERGRALKSIVAEPDDGERQRMGTGVGLALSRAILNAHGGDILWRAHEAGGSVFECVLPLSSDTALALPASIFEEEETT
jgi:two-component system, OmpR family, sensor histidine kinase KdpD